MDKESMPPLAIFRLACTTVREAKDLMPDVPAQLYRAALECSPPSAMMLKPILDQLRPQQWFNFVQQMIELPPGEGYMPPVDAPGLVEEMEDLLGPPF